MCSRPRASPARQGGPTCRRPSRKWMTRSRRFFASSPWIANGKPDYVNLGYTSRGLAKQALMRLSRKSLAIFRKLGLDSNNKIKKSKCFIWCRLGARSQRAILSLPQLYRICTELPEPTVLRCFPPLLPVLFLLCRPPVGEKSSQGKEAKKRCRRATNGSASSVQADNGAANERCLSGL